MNQLQNTSLPVFFEEHTSKYFDARFTLAKVFIAHVGENRNRCFFTKEVLQSMIPSLSNIPILAHIVKGEDGENEFGAHDKKIVKKGNQLEITYQGHAYGIVPQDNNARFEFRYGEDGIEREYLVCDVLLWNKFDDFLDIIQKGEGYKNQSMELFPPSIKGYKNDEQIFVFEEAKFEGLCLLGDNVTPAMISSTIELFSFAKNEDYQNMISEFNALYSEVKKGEFMTTETKKDVLVEDIEEKATATSQVEEEVVEATQEATEAPVEEVATQSDVQVGEVVEGSTEVVEGESTFADKKDEETQEDDKDDKEEDEEEKKEKFTVSFDLSHDDIRTGLYKALNGHADFQEKWYWIPQVFDNYFFMEMEDENKMFKVNYVKHENAVSIGEYQEVFKMVVTGEEQAKIIETRNSIQEMEAKIAELQEFKDGIEYAEKEQKLNSYAHLIDEDSFASIKEGLNEFSLVDIEKEIGLLMLRGKANFSSQDEDSSNTRVNAVNKGEEIPYSSLSSYFYKK